MVVQFEPPLVACVVSSADHSFAALLARKECVIAVPALELAPKVVEVGNCSGRDVEKFERFRSDAGASRARGAASSGRVFRPCANLVSEVLTTNDEELHACP